MTGLAGNPRAAGGFGPAFEGVPYPDWITGSWYDVRSFFGGTTSTVAMNANVIYCSPIIVPKPTPIDQIGINVSVAAAAGKVVRLGIYLPDSRELPGALLIDGGTVAVDTTGDKTVTVSLIVPAGIIYPAMASDGTPTVQALTGAGFLPPYGVLTPAGANYKGSPNLATTGTTLTNPYNGTNHATNSVYRISVRAA